ncbi:MAG: nucleotide exchange factor GrpE [Ignavibacteriae bacterium]|nr:nucleotide exchange factor GrpE [Ignavibacteriota bacterium]MCB9206047.1 nucleotide exchange factor GrpE [Ignavibacteriales bacterium]MCB9209322.1 nucleotide exchange factor GrpE [Ignavibacteriales bacterium]MCB9257966.1 nucleotide exchange factor GrpE [Ignavibacteriales bacterium]
MSSNKDKNMEEKEIEINDSNEEKNKESKTDEPNTENSQDVEKKIDETENETEEDNSEQISELEEKVRSLQDSLLRKAAEFENYKRRTENDQLNLLKYAAESFILKILPVYDDLGRSLAHADDNKTESLIEGLKLVYDKFTKTLDDQGVKKLEVKGKEFDVEYHEALMQQPSNDVPGNTVLEEIEAGYTYKDKVIKHAKVIVSQEIEKPVEENSDQNNGNEE